MKKRGSLTGYAIRAFITFCVLATMSGFTFAEDTICARVKIEIQQELTLERQAFEAHMKINNGLTGISLEDVDIDVSFTDADGVPVLASSDPDNTDAKFFIKVDSMDGVSDVDGNGTVAPSSSADIYWMIIPAQDASNGLESGTLYYVGATLKYTIGGEENITTVSPDYIYVKPMPNISLDYFLPKDVYGDDPTTEEIVEDIVPFSLGVRVKNSGYGTAKNLKIDSAQPKIIENVQELLIAFTIEGSQVQGEPEEAGLLIDFGDIPPNTTKMARWKMSCTLSGEFKEFNAVFSHSDELGGELTSLMDEINTHLLVREVVVDLPGRDGIWDYLAKDDDFYHVYESNNTVSDVDDLASNATITLSGQNGTETVYAVSAPASAGFSYIKLTDPGAGQKIIKGAVRSDGKLIREDNVWLSKSKNNEKVWQYYLNIFDVNSTGKYSVSLEDSSLMPQPPNMQYIQDKTGVENQQLGFVVQSSDPNGETPILSASPLPAGAVFTDKSPGEATFNWTPAEGQAGQYTITFKASDGALDKKQHVVITINSASDTDGDGMKDAWEISYFGSLDRDGTGDFDSDGIRDIDEYDLGTNPNFVDSVPGLPEIIFPATGDEADTLSPSFIIENSYNPGTGTIAYEFELYMDKAFKNKLAGNDSIAEGDALTTWTAPDALTENSRYYWRVRAVTGGVKTEWVYSEFTVNTVNEPSGAFLISSPANATATDTLSPVLAINNAVDPDGDVMTYRFDVFADAELTVPVVSSGDIAEGMDGATFWTVSDSLSDATDYFWRVTATDGHGLQVTSETATVSTDTTNSAPSVPVISQPDNNSIVTGNDIDLIIVNSSDSDSSTLVYYYEIDVVNTFDSAFKIASGQIDEGDTTTVLSISSLEENILYYWRVKSSDGSAESPWATASFRMSSVNDAPLIPTVRNPGSKSWTRKLKPELSVNYTSDPENDQSRYDFEICSDGDCDDSVTSGESSTRTFISPVDLNDNSLYFWRFRAIDEYDGVSDWSKPEMFYVNSSGYNNPPKITLLKPAEDITVESGSLTLAWTDSDPDSDAFVNLYYDTDNTGNDGTLITSGISENSDGDADSYVWNVTGMSGVFYIYAEIKDQDTTAYSYAAGVVTIITDSDGDGIADHLDAFPDDKDEWEDTDNDGTGNNEDTDDDNDSMPDTWETENSFDPLDGADATLDPDGDSFTNLEEYTGKSDPLNNYSIPTLEDFETNSLEAYSWSTGGHENWQVVEDDNTINPDSSSSYIVKSPVLSSAQSSFLSVRVYCEAGTISFGLSVDSIQDEDSLKFYIDNSLQDTWTGTSSYTNSPDYSVEAGMHTFRWEFQQESTASGRCAWLDAIRFPMSVDRDNDLMADRWEAENGLNNLVNDAKADYDNDGFSNLAEFAHKTLPNDSESIPEVIVITETFETGILSLSTFKWNISGNAAWRVADNLAQSGLYSAESPLLNASEDASLDTINYCVNGEVSFWYMTDTEENGDYLKFYIDDIETDMWSGAKSFGYAGPYSVSRGIHKFRWEFDKNGETSTGEDLVRIDSISIPGNLDGDYDGMPDEWEIENDMNPMANDAEGDADDDGTSNIDAYVIATSPGDNEPPVPVADFAVVPTSMGTDAITMTGITATDQSGVQYFFEETTGHSGGTSSSWQDSSVYTDTGLEPETTYSYRVKIRDKSSNYNETSWSEVLSATTEPPPDITPPSPNPPVFSQVPSANGTTDTIIMTVGTATDPGGVEYYFEETSGQTGGSDSGWQDSTGFTNTGLNPDTTYSYRVKARDKSVNNNETSWSEILSATTDPPPDTTPPSPNPTVFSQAPTASGTTDTITMTAGVATDPNGVEYYFEETSGLTGGSDSGWQDSASYTNTGLSPNTTYAYRVRVRDKSANQNETSWSAALSATTEPPPDTTPPSPNPPAFSQAPTANGSKTSVTMTAGTATDPNGVEYYFDETGGQSGGSDSGWQDIPIYTDSGLNSDTTYTYRLKVRDKSPAGNETGWSGSLSAKTDAEKSGCGVAPQYRNGKPLSRSGSSSFGLAIVPLIPALISLLVWFVAFRRKENSEN